MQTDVHFLPVFGQIRGILNTSRYSVILNRNHGGRYYYEYAYSNRNNNIIIIIAVVLNYKVQLYSKFKTVVRIIGSSFHLQNPRESLMNLIYLLY